MKNNVYFAAASGRIKIGCSTNIERRLAGINNHLFEPLSLIGSLPGSFGLEKTLQRRLAAYNIKGEWFSDCPEIRDLIRQVLFYGPQAIGLKPARLIGRQPTERRTKALQDVKQLISRARVVWPRKTAAHLAHAAGCSERNAKYWLSGRSIPGGASAVAIATAMASMTRAAVNAP